MEQFQTEQVQDELCYRTVEVHDYMVVALENLKDAHVAEDKDSLE